MALALNDIIQINAETLFLGEVCLNVFHYRLTVMEPGVDYQDLQDDFGNWWEIHVSPVVSANAVLHNQTILNLTNGLDIDEEIVSIPGTVAGSDLPSYAAWGFRLVRSTRLTRHGSKRFVGVIEETTIGNAQDPALNGELETLATGLQDGVLRTGTAEDFTLSPVIIGRTLVGGVYELDLTKINPVADAVFTHLTTQNSRKAF